MERRSLLLAIAGLGLTAPFAHAEIVNDLLTVPETALAIPFDVLGGDDAFRSSELAGGQYATLTSQAALARSSNAAVRQFAQLEINEQIAVAAALGATAGTAPMRPDQAAQYERLRLAPARRFDRMYIMGQIAGHHELLALNSAYVQSGINPQDRSVAILAVPTIETHLAILTRLSHGGAA